MVAVFEAHGIFALHVTHEDDGLWRASLETVEQHDDPARDIAALLAVVESLTESDRRIWLGCSRREFNIGYESGSGPRVLDNNLSAELLTRIAAVNGSVGITLYERPTDESATTG